MQEASGRRRGCSALAAACPDPVHWQHHALTPAPRGPQGGKARPLPPPHIRLLLRTCRPV